MERVGLIVLSEMDHIGGTPKAVVLHGRISVSLWRRPGYIATLKTVFCYLIEKRVVAGGWNERSWCMLRGYCRTPLQERLGVTVQAADLCLLFAISVGCLIGAAALAGSQGCYQGRVYSTRLVGAAWCMCVFFSPCGFSYIN